MQNLKNNLTLLKNLGIIKGGRAILAKKSLHSTKLDSDTKDAIAKQLGLTRGVNRAKTAIFARYATSFAILGIFVIAQWALPGQTLYSVKKKTEDARALVQPGFKEELKIIRKSQSTDDSDSEDNGNSSAQGNSKTETKKQSSDDRSGSDSSNESSDSHDDTTDNSGSGSSGSGSGGHGSDD